MSRRPQACHAGRTPAPVTGVAAPCGPGCSRFGLAALLAAVRRWSCLLLLMALGSHHAHAAEPVRNATEASVKAAYLYKFAAYIEWPPAAFVRTETPFVIGIVGADDIAAELNKIKAAASVGGRPLEVRVLRPGEAAGGVHILFFGQQDAARLTREIKVTVAQPILTVTENGNGLLTGSIINFVNVSNRIRFEVSLANADRNSIKVSVRLLNVALRVEARKS